MDNSAAVKEGNYSSFISTALLSSKRTSFINFSSNYPYSEPMMLASKCHPKGYVAEGLGMIDLVMLLMERLAQECEQYFLFFFIFGGKDTGALAEQCDVSGL